MRSLFSRILLWFLVTTCITLIGFLIITAITLAEAPERQRPFARLVPFHLNEARRAYESGGKEALAAYMERLETAFQIEGVMTDSLGRDLITGGDRADLMAAARTRRARLLFRLRRTVIGRMSDDGRYWLFFLIQRNRDASWILSPQYLWVLAIVTLLCYVLARQLAKPVEQIERAVARFGQGDFSARTGSSRNDELGRLARAFDQMAERIQLLVASQRRLLLDISHELRSPLARLSVAVELARTGEDRGAALDRIQKEADRLNSLVGELLQVTRAETDPSTMRREPVRLDELVQEIVADAEIEAVAHGNSILLGDAPEIVVTGDPELLRRAVENIVRNAVRFGPASTQIDVTLRGEPQRAHLTVRDRGPGVPEHELSRIFEPFYRVESDRGRSTGGVGLGLAIAQRAVELHGGRLRARNAGPGLEVELELPISPA